MWYWCDAWFFIQFVYKYIVTECYLLYVNSSFSGDHRSSMSPFLCVNDSLRLFCALTYCDLLSSHCHNSTWSLPNLHTLPTILVWYQGMLEGNDFKKVSVLLWQLRCIFNTLPHLLVYNARKHVLLTLQSLLGKLLQSCDELLLSLFMSRHITVKILPISKSN